MVDMIKATYLIKQVAFKKNYINLAKFVGDTSR